MKNLKRLLILIIFILILVILAGMYKFNYLANQPGYDVDGNKVETRNLENLDHLEIDGAVRVPSQYVCVGEFCDGSGIGDDVEMTVLNIPLIKDGGTIGCGADLFFAPHGIPKTITPLDETYKLLFDLKPLPKVEDGFRNPLGNYTKLFYKNVTLNNGIAKVYLTGEMYGPGHCAEPEMREQVTRAALQFDTVDRVEVYLNGSIYDWCEMDQSDGEGGCPENPRYWIETK